jgi:hypothetical protein
VTLGICGYFVYSKFFMLPALFNQSSGYDVYRCHVVLCIIVAIMSVDVTHVSNYYIVDTMPVGNALVRCACRMF